MRESLKTEVRDGITDGSRSQESQTSNDQSTALAPERTRVTTSTGMGKNEEWLHEDSGKNCKF